MWPIYRTAPIAVFYSAMLLNKFEPHSQLGHNQKDLCLAINMADKIDQPLHVSEATNDVGLLVPCHK